MKTKDLILSDAIEKYIEAEREIQRQKKIIIGLIASVVALIGCVVVLW